MRRRGLVVLLVTILVALGAGVAIVASSPTIRARYHLRRVTAAEVKLQWRAPSLPTGHALAFAQNPAAKELLPELIELAHAEAQRDEEACYRSLLFEITTGSGPRWSPVAAEQRVLLRREHPLQAPIDVLVLRSLVECLRARESNLRLWSLSRLPLDERLIEVVIRHPDQWEALDWLGAFALNHEAYVREFEEWKRASLWGTVLLSPGGGARELDFVHQTMRGLESWLEKNRNRLPEQVR